MECPWQLPGIHGSSQEGASPIAFERMVSCLNASPFVDVFSLGIFLNASPCIFLDRASPTTDCPQLPTRLWKTCGFLNQASRLRWLKNEASITTTEPALNDTFDSAMAFYFGHWRRWTSMLF